MITRCATEVKYRYIMYSTKPWRIAAMKNRTIQSQTKVGRFRGRQIVERIS